MAADLRIHVFADGELTEQDFIDFNRNTLGSKWYDPIPHGHPEDRFSEAYSKFSGTRSIWVGEVSWLKAAVFDDKETFVPAPVRNISNVIGEDWPIVDDVLINEIRIFGSYENRTQYSVEDIDRIVEWLEEHRGLHACTVSW
jgi:hypothetical protein